MRTSAPRARSLGAGDYVTIASSFPRRHQYLSAKPTRVKPDWKAGSITVNEGKVWTLAVVPSVGWWKPAKQGG